MLRRHMVANRILAHMNIRCDNPQFVTRGKMMLRHLDQNLGNYSFASCHRVIEASRGGKLSERDGSLFRAVLKLPCSEWIKLKKRERVKCWDKIGVASIAALVYVVSPITLLSSLFSLIYPALCFATTKTVFFSFLLSCARLEILKCRF